MWTLWSAATWFSHCAIASKTSEGRPRSCHSFLCHMTWGSYEERDLAIRHLESLIVIGNVQDRPRQYWIYLLVPIWTSLCSVLSHRPQYCCVTVVLCVIVLFKAEHRSTYRWPGSEPADLIEIGPLIGICMNQPELWPKPISQVLTKSRLTHELTQILKNDL